MKRLCSLMLLFTLLTTFPAYAATWFPDDNKLHSDPFCIDRRFCFSTYYSLALECATEADTLAEGLPLCESCALAGDAASNLYAPVTWYYNPNGGRFYHRDQNCSSIHSYLLPLSGIYVDESRTWQPDNPCSSCGYAPTLLRAPSDPNGLNATIEEKAALLPGIWTLPGKDAISFSAAADAAHAYLLTILPKETYRLYTLHYDQCSPEGPRETWKVIATTELGHPVCVVYVDALTGEVYQHQLAEEFAGLSGEASSLLIE